MNPAKLKTTPEEQDQLDWCCLALTEEQIYECEQEASEIAGAELYQDQAAAILIPLLARILIRNIQAERTGDAQ